MMQYTMLWRGQNIENSKYMGMGTSYHKQLILNTET